MFGILLHVVVKWKNEKYLASIMDDSAIMCDEVIELYNEETNFTEKKSNLQNAKFRYFTSILINYYSIIDSC